jgi:hypothetical protein
MMHDHHEHGAHGEVHLPPPSSRPIVMAFGITLFAAGLVTSIWLVVAGLLIFLFGLGGWIYDDIVQDKALQHE